MVGFSHSSPPSPMTSGYASVKLTERPLRLGRGLRFGDRTSTPAPGARGRFCWACWLTARAWGKREMLVSSFGRATVGGSGGGGCVTLRVSAELRKASRLEALLLSSSLRSLPPNSLPISRPLLDDLASSAMYDCALSIVDRLQHLVWAGWCFWRWARSPGRSAPPRYGAVLAPPVAGSGKTLAASTLVLLPVRGWMAAVAVQRLKPQRTGDEAVGGTELASQHMQKRCRRGQAAGMSIVQVCFSYGMPLVQVLPTATEAWEGALLHGWFIRIYSRTRCYVVTRESNWP